MSKVLEFPTSERKAEAILQQLESSAEGLEEGYAELDSLHAELHEAEQIAEKQEQAYNTLMKEYRNYVDPATIPFVLVQYCSDARIKIDGETVRFEFEDEDES